MILKIWNLIEDYTDDDNEEVGQIKYSAYVWHLADWTGFMKFLTG